MHRHIVTQPVLRWVLGFLLALSPLAGYPLGLGKLQVKSALNEPLNAEIDITSIADHELKGLNVSLASRAEFEAAGAERLPLLSQIKFSVAKRPDGRYFVQLKTDAPVEEPFLHVLLQIEWSGGKLVREYSALIDPPSYMVGKPAAVEAPQAAPAVEPIKEPEPSSKFVETIPPPTEPADKTASPAVGTTTTPIPEPLAARPAEPQPVEKPAEPAPEAPKEITVAAPTEQPAPPPVESKPAPVPAASQDTGWSNAVEYTVRPGDTLWAIADRIRADKQLTLEQVMLGIFRNNKDAFFRDNVNNLRAGKVLKMPERDEIDAMPASEAVREFRAQYDAWQEYKLKLAAASGTLKVNEPQPAPAEKAAKPEDAAATKPEAETKKPAEKTAAAKQSQQDLLKIVRGSVDADKAAPAKSAETESAKDAEKRERTALAERVATLEESIQSKQLEQRELSEKVGQVRSQIKNEKRLIELENQSLAQQTAKKPPETKPEVAETKPAPKPEAKPEPPAPAPDAKPKEPEAAAQPVKPAPSKRITPPPPPPEEKGFITSLLDDVLGDSILPIVGVAVALLGGVILIIYLRRRRRSIAEFEESILASDAIASEATTPTGTVENTGQVTTGDTSFLSDFSKSGMGQVHTDEVDPIAEAEVYLAYGRDETAEEILKEAIVKNPDRQELKQKLLEIYHQRNDVNAFETLAEELYASLGGRGGKILEKVEEMGRKLNPDNPMFRGGAPAPARRASDRADAGAATTRAMGMASVAVAAAPATQVVENRSSIDFDFDAAPAASAPSGESGGLDFDLNLSEVPETKPAGGGGGSAEANALDSIDFGSPADNVIDFEAGKGSAPAMEVSEVEAAPAGGEDEIKWEMDTPVTAAAAAESTDAGMAGGGNGADAHWDETATKLDLAKAYIDMGDAEGARSILDEVLAEGNEQQKKQAAELAAQIA